MAFAGLFRTAGVQGICRPFYSQVGQEPTGINPQSSSEKRGFMAKLVLFDEIHISVLVSQSIGDSESNVMHRVLTSARFRTGLLQAVRVLIRQYSVLDRTQITISR
jgi:hypothetical protein